ncbi:MAG: glutathione S-transferase family protein [Hyphomicrobiaceae bacterium]|jgi:glutathione S-transferase
MLKVWGRKTSVNVQKVMWAVAELGLAHERIDAGGTFGRTDTAEYGAMNPNRLVPTIDDDGFQLWESSAIVRYLSEAYGRGTLAPEGRHAYARADQWMEWATTSLYADLIGTCFVQLVRTTAAERNGAAVDAAVKRLAQRLTILDKHLADRQFIVGDRLSMADIGVGALMYRYYNLEIARTRLAHLEAWYQRLTDRKAYQDHVMIDFEAMKVPGA